MTPTIIIRLVGRSILSQAVSTADILSRLGISVILPGALSLPGTGVRRGCGGTYNSRSQFPATNFLTVSDDMSKLKKKFETAVADSKKLPERPSNDALLKLYALYKQATDGDVEGKRPGFTDMVGRAKYDAWAEVKGTSTDDAMQRYVDLVESLKD
jgi:acyl-CoA-binding protein